MSKQKNKPSKSGQAIPPEKPAQKQASTVSEYKTVSRWTYILSILALTLIAYQPVLNAGFVDWDDPDYVINNLAVQQFNLKDLITQPLQGNYHPLTMISLAFNYAISGNEAGSYHVLNLILHLLNTMLVFIFIHRLSGQKIWMAFIVSLLFGIHPMHVESVAWVAERKDVLYSFFFLAGLIFYLKYLEKPTLPTWLIVFGLFLFSIMSKPSAVIFPVSLLCIDYLKNRWLQPKAWIEKVPFFIASIGMGLLTLHAQTQQGAVASADMFSGVFRFFFGFYGLMMYMWKAILPINLVTFYPFPAVNSVLPWPFYVSVAVGIATLALIVIMHKRNRLVSFAFIFFIVHLALVLQFMPVGSAIIADRYTYLPYIGLFIIPGFLMQHWAERNQGKLPMAGMLLIGVIAIAFTYLSNLQAATWKDGVSLWDHAIAVSPSSRAYANRGLLYKKEKNYPAAIEMYSNAINMNKAEFEALLNRGNVYFDLGKQDSAMQDYRRCFALNKKSVKLLTNMGSSFGQQMMYDSAVHYFNQSLAIDEKNLEALSARAFCLYQLQQYDQSLNDISKHSSIKKDAELISLQGIIYQAKKLYQQSIPSFDEAISLNPNNGTYYLNRSLSYFNLGDKQKAKPDALKAQQVGARLPDNYLQALQ